jgi:hypothetical protein
MQNRQDDDNSGQDGQVLGGERYPRPAAARDPRSRTPGWDPGGERAELATRVAGPC